MEIVIPDWEVDFDTFGESAKFVGARANCIAPARPADKAEIAAVFEFDVAREIVGTFTNILYARKKGPSQPLIWWETPKNGAHRDAPQELALLRKNLVF
jgi:hypothetical protein